MRESLLAALAFATLAACTVERTGLLRDPDGSQREVDGRLPDSGDPPARWWDTAFAHRRKILFDRRGETEALDDVPVLVTLPPSVVVAGDFAAGGADVRFVDDDGMTTLAYETEAWDVDEGASFWVRVPRLEVGTDDHVWLYYANPSAPAATRPNLVWMDGHVGVWHLATDLEDSSGTNEPALDRRTTSEPGRIANGRGTNVTEDAAAYLDARFQRPLATFTVSAWARPNALPSEEGSSHIVTRGPAFGITWDESEEAFAGAIEMRIGLTWYSAKLEPGRAGEWQHFAGTYDGEVLVAYTNGAPTDTNEAPSGAPLSVTTLTTKIGRHVTNTSADSHFRGIIDEVRIEEVARSPEYLRTQYRSMSGELASLGDEERRPSK